ncbi:MAG TPA: deaminase, partial [Anaerolineaceae bacterium]|nr:deaminase [Anaerolineaceae bacterium]
MNAFDESVRQQIEKLTTLSPREVEAATTAKRQAWRQQHPWASSTPPTPRAAFESLFFDYMGLSPEDLPIVAESENRITWRSQNPCPTLDACLQLGLDTRRVCRAAYEKSTQAFVSQIDPQLRFHRSYQEIRPYAAHCLETIVRLDFAAMMRLAIAEAQQSRQEGNKGYGAVLVHDGRVLASAHDTAATEHDPSLHAELKAIRQAV